MAGLSQLDEALWVSEEPIRVFGIPTRHRMSVMRLTDGRLVIHSPTRPTPELLAELEGLGPAAAILAPSWWHDLYLGEWSARAPSAMLYGAPALVRAQPALPVETLSDDPPALWSGQIEQQHVRGIGLKLDEFAFHHLASRSLIVADLLFNYDDTFEPATRAVGRYVLGSYPGCRFPSAFRLLVRDRAALRASIDRILAWDFKRIVFGHGIVVEEGAKNTFRAAFAWLSP